MIFSLIGVVIDNESLTGWIHVHAFDRVSFSQSTREYGSEGIRDSTFRESASDHLLVLLLIVIRGESIDLIVR